jgi:hypothetical protein
MRAMTKAAVPKPPRTPGGPRGAPKGHAAMGMQNGLTVFRWSDPVSG